MENDKSKITFKDDKFGKEKYAKFITNLFINSDNY